MSTAAPSQFAQNLARIRKQRGLSQADLAELAGLSRRMINHYETHAIQPPIEKIEAIARALGIRPSQLFDTKLKVTEKDAASDLTGIDPRSVKKLKDILSLPPEDRNVLYRMLNELLRKNQLEERDRGAKQTAIIHK